MNWLHKLCCCLQQHALGVLVLLLILAWGVATWFLSVDLKEGIGLFGSVASLLGLAYTVIQLLKTKTISEETKQAARDAVDKLRTSEYRYAVVKARSLLREIRTLLDGRNWKIAAIRLRDLAEACSEIAYQPSEIDKAWKSFAANSSYWADEFRDGKTNVVHDYDICRWNEFYLAIADRIEIEISPFHSESDNEND